jgi:hypothetical protein
VFTRYFARQISSVSRPIFDFPGGLVHGCVKAPARDRTQA